MYTKPPSEVAIPKFGGYNIQLPRLLEKKEPDFTSDLYCWCYTLYTAHLEKKTVQEVVAVTPGLQAFADRDAGFRQFIDRYETVSADPETRREYAMWFDEALREEGMLDWARQEVRDEYEPRLAEAERKRKEDLEEAERKRQEDKKQIARNLKTKGMSIADIVEMTGLSTGEAEKA
ncbi:MAG: hypothetical protein FWF80_08785 [Defluviitaleaceae bacterium]|nr:hypothetical protein [Defluviitaleaceae bacterium]